MSFLFERLVKRQVLASAVLAIFAILSLESSAFSQGLSIAQAKELSEKTGRPILAIGGTEQCGFCVALKKRLKTEGSLHPILAQYVNLEINTESPEWQEWARKHPHEGNGIPIIYLVRPDGQTMHAKSGAPEGAGLPKLLVEGLSQSGTLYTKAQLEGLVKLKGDFEKAVAEKKPVELSKVFNQAKKYGEPGRFGSYASISKEVDTLLANYINEVDSSVKALKDRVSYQGEDSSKQFELALEIANAKRDYGSLYFSKEAVNELVVDFKKVSGGKELFSEAEIISKAVGQATSDSGKKIAKKALEGLIAKHPDSPAAEYAKARLEEWAGEGESE